MCLPSWLYLRVLRGSVVGCLAAGGRVFAAVARGFRTAECADDDGGGAADSGVDGDGLRRAVARAGPAFHAPIPIYYLRLPILDDVDSVGTDFRAHPATRTLIRVQRQSDDVIEIPQFRHPLHSFQHPTLID